jgi:uncharacterized protein YwqG
MPDNNEKPGSTRIGGDPDLPPSFEWPVIDQQYLAFLCQVNLAELPRPEGSPLPERGILYFFLGRDETAYDVEHRINYYDGDVGLLRATPHPPRDRSRSDYEEYKPFQVTSSIAISLPDFGSDLIYDEIGLDDENLDRYIELLERFEPAHERRMGISQMLGYPKQFTGDSPFLEAYFALNGHHTQATYERLEGVEHGLLQVARKLEAPVEYYDVDLATNEIVTASTRATDEKLFQYYSELKADVTWYLANKDAIDAESRELVLLLDLASDFNIGMCWWDAGNLQFVISKDDLAALSFSRTYACVLTS